MDDLTLFGLVAVTAMLAFYALEDRSPWFILAFAGACLLASAYGFLQDAWPVGSWRRSGQALPCTAGASGWAEGAAAQVWSIQAVRFGAALRPIVRLLPVFGFLLALSAAERRPAARAARAHSIISSGSSKRRSGTRQ